jgi:hypothetical protein
MPANLPSARNLQVRREPQQRVQYALHENHATCPASGDCSSWDADVSRGGAACGARADRSGESCARGDGRLEDSERRLARAASAARVTPSGEARPAEIVLLVDRRGLHRRRPRHATICIHVVELRRTGSFGAALFAAAGAGVLRFHCLVCHGKQLSGMENGAIRALAQDLPGSAGMLDGGQPGGIRLHAGASIAARKRAGAVIQFADDARAINR